MPVNEQVYLYVRQKLEAGWPTLVMYFLEPELAKLLRISDEHIATFAHLRASEARNGGAALVKIFELSLVKMLKLSLVRIIFLFEVGTCQIYF